MYYLAPLVRVTKARRSLRAPVGISFTDMLFGRLGKPVGTVKGG